jgi:hypothetical protein
MCFQWLGEIIQADVPRKLGHAPEGVGIRVDQSQGAAFKFLGEEHVSKHAQSEAHAPGANEGDLRRIRHLSSASVRELFGRRRHAHMR